MTAHKQGWKQNTLKKITLSLNEFERSVLKVCIMNSYRYSFRSWTTWYTVAVFRGVLFIFCISSNVHLKSSPRTVRHSHSCSSKDSNRLLLTALCTWLQGGCTVVSGFQTGYWRGRQTCGKLLCILDRSQTWSLCLSLVLTVVVSSCSAERTA